MQEPSSGHSLAGLEPGEQQEQALGWPLDALGLARAGECLLEGVRDCPAPPTLTLCNPQAAAPLCNWRRDGFFLTTEAHGYYSKSGFKTLPR